MAIMTQLQLPLNSCIVHHQREEEENKPRQINEFIPRRNYNNNNETVEQPLTEASSR